MFLVTLHYRKYFSIKKGKECKRCSNTDSNTALVNDEFIDLISLNFCARLVLGNSSSFPDSPKLRLSQISIERGNSALLPNVFQRA